MLQIPQLPQEQQLQRFATAYQKKQANAQGLSMEEIAILMYFKQKGIS